MQLMRQLRKQIGWTPLKLKRIIWPTKEEAARRSAVVLAVSVLLGVIIAVLDRVLLLLTDVIISL